MTDRRTDIAPRDLRVEARPMEFEEGCWLVETIDGVEVQTPVAVKSFELTVDPAEFMRPSGRSSLAHRVPIGSKRQPIPAESNRD